MQNFNPFLFSSEDAYPSLSPFETREGLPYYLCPDCSDKEGMKFNVYAVTISSNSQFINKKFAYRALLRRITIYLGSRLCVCVISYLFTPHSKLII